MSGTLCALVFKIKLNVQEVKWLLSHTSRIAFVETKTFASNCHFCLCTFVTKIILPASSILAVVACV